jgi:hypothetical protein
MSNLHREHSIDTNDGHQVMAKAHIAFAKKNIKM